jgi:type III secretion system FlhB-like substrate exporter
MEKYIFIADSKNKYYNQNPLPLPGEYMPIPRLIPGYLCKGEIFYKFNDPEYKTLENFNEIIKNICVLLVSRNKLAIGLRYVQEKDNAPKIIIKETNIKIVIGLCKKNNIEIKYDKILTEYIFEHSDKNQEIPTETYQKVATILAKIRREKKCSSQKE